MKNKQISKEIGMASGNDLMVLQAAYKAWTNGSALRATRNRNKAFTYGRQWEDLMQDELGNTVTEGENMRNRGCQPITNNLIRQMVKTVIGRFRNRRMSEKTDETVGKVYKSCLLDEVDSRALEEFLISGCVVQRIDVDSTTSLLPTCCAKCREAIVRMPRQCVDFTPTKSCTEPTISPHLLAQIGSRAPNFGEHQAANAEPLRFGRLRAARCLCATAAVRRN